jgi:hypothetical protein
MLKLEKTYHYYDVWRSRWSHRQCRALAVTTMAHMRLIWHMVPLTAGELGLPCRPCLGPWQLKFGDYQSVITVLWVLGMAC